jgi:hypothetical protein
MPTSTELAEREARMIVSVLYTNYRGETRERRIYPLGLQFTCNRWHPEPQWLLTAIDQEDHQQKTFALKDIHRWSGGGSVVWMHRQAAEEVLAALREADFALKTQEDAERAGEARRGLLAVWAYVENALRRVLRA